MIGCWQNDVTELGRRSFSRSLIGCCGADVTELGGSSLSESRIGCRGFDVIWCGMRENINIEDFYCWKINGVRTKLEKGNVQILLIDYDIICLNEVKTPLNC